MKKIIKTLYGFVTHSVGRVTKRFCFEDYIRVYPDGIACVRMRDKHNLDKVH